jgi:HD-like signal output (HDOD) protein
MEAHKNNVPDNQPTGDSQLVNIDRFIKSLLEDLKANRLELPTLPQVAIKINKVIKDPTSSSKDVAQVVRTDPALTARLIQVANSPMVRGDHKVDNIQTAVTRMGASMVQNIVTTFLVRQLFQTRHQSLHTRMATIWNHSAHVAAICHVLADRFSTLRTDEAMLAGLVHDIGKLPVLAKAKRMSNFEENAHILDRVMDKLHPALGKTILETWHFEPEIITAAAEHENIHRNSTTLDLTDIVIVANLHSYAGKPQTKNLDWMNIPAMKKLDLDAEKSIEVLEAAHDEIIEIRDLLTN